MRRRLSLRIIKMLDVCKIKRLFSLKPALLVAAFFLVFNLGKMSPSSSCTNSDRTVLSQGLGEARQDSIVVPREVKSQQLRKSMARLDAILEGEHRERPFNYVEEEDDDDDDSDDDGYNGDNINDNDNRNTMDINYNKNNNDNDNINSNNKNNEEEVELLNLASKKEPDVKLPEPVVNVAVKTPEATKKENTTKTNSNNNKAVVLSAADLPKNHPTPKPHIPQPQPVGVDYYGTNTEAHHKGLKRHGYSSAHKHSYKSMFIVDPHIYGKDTIRKPPGYRTKKIIACFNCPQRFFVSNKYNNDFKQCPYSECELSRQSGMNDKADMMLFWQSPEIEYPPQRPKGQLWTFLSWEAPPHRSYPRPAKNWQNAFNYTMTYLSDADFVLPYDSLVWRDESLLHPEEYYIEQAKKKTRMAAWWVSHCDTRAKRRAYVDEMKKYIPDIDIYGSCGNLTCSNSHADDCWKSLNTTYRFYLSFENSFCPEYVTEKFFKMFRYRYPVIPVVRGGFDYNKHFPRDILINAGNFANAKDLSNYLIQLSKDPVRLGKMYMAKDKFAMLNRKMDWCDFCEKMHTGKFKKQVIPDVIRYSTHSRPCWDAPNDTK